MTPEEAMRRIDTLLSHVWMVRTFIKHSEEVEEDDELAELHRTLYDYMLALGGPLKNGDGQAYLRLAEKKYSKLRRATDQFQVIHAEISGHLNFRMAAQSLLAAVDQIGEMLESASRGR